MFFHFETAAQYITVYLHHDYLSEKRKKTINKCLLQQKPYSDNLDSKLIVFNINTTLIFLFEINSCYSCIKFKCKLSIKTGLCSFF